MVLMRYEGMQSWAAHTGKEVETCCGIERGKTVAEDVKGYGGLMSTSKQMISSTAGSIRCIHA